VKHAKEQEIKMKHDIDLIIQQSMHVYEHIKTINKQRSTLSSNDYLERWHIVESRYYVELEENNPKGIPQTTEEAFAEASDYIGCAYYCAEKIREWE